MKIKSEHLKELQTAFDTLKRNCDFDKIKENYKNLNIPRAEFVKDINVRFRFDTFCAMKEYLAHGFITKIYVYANDDHLNTALKNVIPNI